MVGSSKIGTNLSEKSRTSQRIRRVALIMETAVAPRRRMLDGLARYIQEHDPWALYLKPFMTGGRLTDWLKDWNGDGVITVVKGSELAPPPAPPGLSLVYCGGQAKSGHLPIVVADNQSIGQLAADHLLERGFRHFAFVRHPLAAWSVERWDAFSAAVGQFGFACSIHNLPEPDGGPSGPEEWERQQLDLMQWIATLPKPIGIMTSTDRLGQQVLEACQRAAAVVPEQVAVIGADDDETMCRLCNPPLSSVIIDDHARGYRAAAVLDQLMNGGPSPTEPILIPARGVVARGSTDVLAINDSTIANAIRFIREHACDEIDIDDVAKRVMLSRRVLERRFKALTGRTPNNQILRFRLDRAVSLLTETDLGLKEIAIKAGFGSPSYMGAVFQRVLRRTPGSYRPLQNHRLPKT